MSVHPTVFDDPMRGLIPPSWFQSQRLQDVDTVDHRLMSLLTHSTQ
jgi:hypothetical protein